MASMMLLDSLKQMVTCSVCLEEKADQKMLPCQHTLCVSCLNGVCADRSSFKCPVCKKSHDVPNGGILSYPNSLICNQLGDILKQDVEMPADVTASRDVRPKVEDSSVRRKNNQEKLATELQAVVDHAKRKLRFGEKELRHQKTGLESLNSQGADSKKKITDLVEGMEKYKNDREETFRFLRKDLETARVQHTRELSKYERDLKETRGKLEAQRESLGQVLSVMKQGEELDESHKALLLPLIMNPKDNLDDLQQFRTAPTQYRLRPNTLFNEIRQKIQSDVKHNNYNEWNFKSSFSADFAAKPRDTFREQQVVQVLGAASTNAKQIRIKTESGNEGLVCCESERVFWISDDTSSYFDLGELHKVEILENIFKVDEKVWLRRDLEYIPELFIPLTEDSIGTVVSCTGYTVVINFPEVINWTGNSEIFEFVADIKPNDLVTVTCDEYDTRSIKFKGQHVRVQNEGAEYYRTESVFLNPNDLITVTYRLEKREKRRRNKIPISYTVETMKVRKEHLKLPMKQTDIPHNVIPIIEPINA